MQEMGICVSLLATLHMHICTICGKSYLDKSSLKRHENTMERSSIVLIVKKCSVLIQHYRDIVFMFMRGRNTIVNSVSNFIQAKVLTIDT